ncbi:polyprenyl synthetase family protein [Kiloniella laminariae]|uniref:Polyprenyl synthetase family protein n=1 Tax=Kiloniella laminariae TaxID=454162 RepID=A0ABT4LE17_9PROT|nr:farnesyl diphosphate synthase [Kiloniella laminariae]MCZ4279338.1 polyprenyl synthetase family protein [Kiloniella laminariae]
MQDITQALSRCANAVEAHLERLLPSVSTAEGEVVEAMRYSALGGGKRLRPFLVMESAALFGVDPSRALQAAAALEMVHCYSLVHDDLPAMDDSDLRRGRATVHRKWNDATAILAGDGLLTEAFTVLASPESHPDAQVRLELITELATAAGAKGMVGGQMIDLSPDRAKLDLAGITRLQALKTGALIRYACEAGAILGQAQREERTALRLYAEDLGLAFQIVDDLLDHEATPEETGKPTGVDSDAGKATFVGQLGLEKARVRAEELVVSAKSRLDIFSGKAQLLREIATFVLERRS